MNDKIHYVILLGRSLNFMRMRIAGGGNQESF